MDRGSAFGAYQVPTRVLSTQYGGNAFSSFGKGFAKGLKKTSKIIRQGSKIGGALADVAALGGLPGAAEASVGFRSAAKGAKLGKKVGKQLGGARIGQNYSTRRKR